MELWKTPDPYTPKEFRSPVPLSNAHEALIESAVERRWVTIKEKVDSITEWTQAKKKQLLELEENTKSLLTDVEHLKKAVDERLMGSDKNLSEIKVKMRALSMALIKMRFAMQTSIDDLKKVYPIPSSDAK